MSGRMVDDIVKFLEGHGINPLYLVTAICVIISASYVKRLKTWRNEPLFRKSIIVSTFFATAVTVILTIVELIAPKR